MTICYECRHCPIVKPEDTEVGFYCSKLKHMVFARVKTDCVDFDKYKGPPQTVHDSWPDWNVSWNEGGGILRAIRELCIARCHTPWHSPKCVGCGRMKAYKFFDSFLPQEPLKKTWRDFDNGD